MYRQSHLNGVRRQQDNKIVSHTNFHGKIFELLQRSTKISVAGLWWVIFTIGTGFTSSHG